MYNQAMGMLQPNFGEDMILIQNDIDRDERKLVIARKFNELYSNDLFREVILETLLGSEMEELVSKLLRFGITDDEEQAILFELKSLKFLKNLLDRKSNDVEKLTASLSESKELLRTVAENKEY